MTCGICRFYDVCAVHNTEQACTAKAEEDGELRHSILW